MRKTEVDKVVERIFKNPNGFTSPEEFMDALVMDLVDVGAAYVWLVINSFNSPCEAFRIPPENVLHRRTTGPSPTDECYEIVTHSHGRSSTMLVPCRDVVKIPRYAQSSVGDVSKHIKGSVARFLAARK